MISGVAGPARLRVRAEVDATPVDWATADLGGVGTRPSRTGVRSAARSGVGVERQRAVADPDPGALGEHVLTAGRQPDPLGRLGRVHERAVGRLVVDEHRVPAAQLDPGVHPGDLVGLVLDRDAAQPSLRTRSSASGSRPSR